MKSIAVTPQIQIFTKIVSGAHGEIFEVCYAAAESYGRVYTRVIGVRAIEPIEPEPLLLEIGNDTHVTGSVLSPYFPETASLSREFHITSQPTRGPSVY